MELDFYTNALLCNESFVLDPVSWYELNPTIYFLYWYGWNGKYMLQWKHGKESGNDI